MNWISDVSCVSALCVDLCVAEWITLVLCIPMGNEHGSWSIEHKLSSKSPNNASDSKTKFIVDAHSSKVRINIFYWFLVIKYKLINETLTIRLKYSKAHTFILFCKWLGRKILRVYLYNPFHYLPLSLLSKHFNPHHTHAVWCEFTVIISILTRTTKLYKNANS